MKPEINGGRDACRRPLKDCVDYDDNYAHEHEKTQYYPFRNQ
jgi:hypothetical protein